MSYNPEITKTARDLIVDLTKNLNLEEKLKNQKNLSPWVKSDVAKVTGDLQMNKSIESEIKDITKRLDQLEIQEEFDKVYNNLTSNTPTQSQTLN